MRVAGLEIGTHKRGRSVPGVLVDSIVKTPNQPRPLSASPRPQDVLKGKGDSKEQLKEILGILHSGPKRPSFLDKPPVTATAGKRPVPAQAAQPVAAGPSGHLDADALMRLLDSEDADQAAR